MKRADFLASLFGGQSLAPKVADGEARIDGAPSALLQLTSWMDKGPAVFPIVTR